MTRATIGGHCPTICSHAFAGYKSVTMELASDTFQLHPISWTSSEWWCRPFPVQVDKKPELAPPPPWCRTNPPQLLYLAPLAREQISTWDHWCPATQVLVLSCSHPTTVYLCLDCSCLTSRLLRITRLWPATSGPFNSLLFVYTVSSTLA